MTSTGDGRPELGAEPPPSPLLLDPWYAHDQPERPLDRAAFACDCPPCALALTAAAHNQPDFPLVVRGRTTRRVLTARGVAGAARSPEGIVGVLPGDDLRDISAAGSGGPATKALVDRPALRQALRRTDPGMSDRKSPFDLGR